MFVVSPPRYIERSDCGYCHCEKEHFLGLETLPKQANPPSKPTHVTIGMYVHQMDTHHYSELVNKGFRRLGSFLYTGDMLRGCCRMYTIRTNTHYYSLTKKHRKVLNRFDRAVAMHDFGDANLSGYHHLHGLLELEKGQTKFRTRFEPAKFSDEKFALYKKYQVKVHNDNPDDVLESQFKSFLCDTPFTDDEVEGDEEQWEFLNNWKSLLGGERKCRRLGPTHECYYWEDKLIAISVLDFLPCGLSSVYFIWDPDFARLSLGTLLGLREILMCELLGLGDYYLGYYIDDCSKMRYKSQFGGEILSVCNEAFLPFDMVKNAMADSAFFVACGDYIRRHKEPDVQLRSGLKRWTLPPKPFQSGGKLSTLAKDQIVTLDKDYVFSDMCDLIYGLPYVYESAKHAMDVLKTDYGLRFGLLPAVLPGAVSMLTLWGWFQTGELSLDSTIYIYKRSGRVASVKIKDLDNTTKASYVDCLRLFGLDLLRETILVV